MIQSLLLLAYLFIYSVEPACQNDHNQSVLLSISINGPSLNRIGVAKYFDTISRAIKNSIPYKNSNIGINTFGDNVSSLLSFGPHTFFFVNKTIYTNLNVIDLDNNYGNMVSKAMLSAHNLLKEESGQRYHVVFAAANPLKTGFGVNTAPNNFDDPCARSIISKSSNIQTYVVLIGKQGINFIKQYYSCLVENSMQNPDSDIIIIDPSSTSELQSGLSQLYSRICKPNGYDVKITEVLPNSTTYSFKPFIEILNRGAPLTITACWGLEQDEPPKTTSSQCSSQGGVVDTGQYFVAYCSQCNSNLNETLPNDFIYIGDLPVNPNNATTWTATALSFHNITHYTMLDFVRFGTKNALNGSSYWPQPIVGRSFELRNVGYNNFYGGNWRINYGDNGASPGTSPKKGLLPLSNSENCVSVECRSNGDTNATCHSNGLYCVCDGQSGYFSDVLVCRKMPLPVSCTGLIIDYWPDWVYVAWDRNDWEDEIKYKLSYNTLEDVYNTLSTGGIPGIAINDTDTYAGGRIKIKVSGNYTTPVQHTHYKIEGSFINCSLSYLTTPTAEPTTQSPNTQSPTQSPNTQSPNTQSPTTQSPTTQSPNTQSPTQSPATIITISSSNINDDILLTEKAEKEFEIFYRNVSIVVVSVVAFVALIGSIDARYVRVNHFYKDIALVKVLFNLLDVLSDIFLAMQISLYIEYGRIFYILFISSIVCIIIPIIATLMQVYRRIKKYWVKNNNIRTWLQSYTSLLMISSIVLGSSFASVELFNSCLFNMNVFCMGLTRQYLLNFRTKRIYSLILLENIPQTLINIIFTFKISKYNGISIITISSLILSIISIIVTIMTLIVSKQLYVTQQYTILSFDVTGNKNEPSYINRINTIRKELGFLLCINKKEIEILRPQIISNGVKFTIYVHHNISDTDNKQTQSHIDFNNFFNQKGVNGKLKLSEIFKNGSELSDYPNIQNTSFILQRSKKTEIAIDLIENAIELQAHYSLSNDSDEQE